MESCGAIKLISWVIAEVVSDMGTNVLTCEMWDDALYVISRALIAAII